MLTAKLLNSHASLNEFKYLDTLEFMVGSPLRMAFRLYDTQHSERHVPADTAIVKVTFNLTDGETLEKTASFIDDGDRSMLVVELTGTETENLMGGNVTFTLDDAGDGSAIVKGWIQLALSKISTSSPCGC